MSQTMTRDAGQKTDAKTYKNYIGGRWVESKSGKTFNSTNPAHKDQVLGVMQASNPNDVNSAIEAAQTMNVDFNCSGLMIRGISDYAGRKRDTETRPDGWKDKAVRNAAIVTGALMKKLATI